MRNTGTFLKLLAVVFLAGGLVSCSSPKNQGSKNLSGAVDKAQRLCQRAIALMANPYYVQKSTGQATPIPKRLAGGAHEPVEPFMKNADEAIARHIGLEKESGDLEVGSMDAVHPEAIKDLETARSELDAALKADADAGEAEKALAKSTQANILKIEAQYYWALAQAQSRKIDPAMELAQHQLGQAQMYAQTINAAEKIVAMGAKDLQKLCDDAAGNLAKLNQEGAAKKTQIAALTTQIDGLTATTSKQQTDTAALERDARDVVGDEALKIADKIAALRQDMCAKVAQMQDLELQRQQLQDDVKVLDVRTACIQAEVKAAGQSLAAKKSMVDSTEKIVTGAQDGLNKAREAAMPAIKAACDAYTAWQDNAKKVSTYLSLALTALGSPQDSHGLAEQGAMQMDLGALNVEIGQGATRMKQQRQNLEGLWSQKAGDSTIGGGKELPAAPKDDAETYVKPASKAFNDAAAAYKSATMKLPREGLKDQQGHNVIEWVYQASEAKAWRALAAASADEAADATLKAENLEKLAKEGRENSPYLKNVDTPVSSK